jgi:hypothetical protein
MSDYLTIKLAALVVEFSFYAGAGLSLALIGTSLAFIVIGSR